MPLALATALVYVWFSVQLFRAVARGCRRDSS